MTHVCHEQRELTKTPISDEEILSTPAIAEPHSELGSDLHIGPWEDNATPATPALGSDLARAAMPPLKENTGECSFLCF